MSIIFDALKKVEKSQGDGSSPTPPDDGKFKVFKYILLAVVVFVGIFAGRMLFRAIAPQVKAMLPSASNKAPAKQSATSVKAPVKTQTTVTSTKKPVSKDTKAAVQKQAVRTAPSSGGYELNGVFESGDDVYALVNNEIVKEGDTIQEAQVVSISLEQVKLRLKDNKTVTIKAQAQ